VEYVRLESLGPEDQRGVGGIVADESTADDPGESTLSRLAVQISALETDPASLWLHHFLLYNLGH
jgi:hypothetical protein